jgi:hypothetical protein
MSVTPGPTVGLTIGTAAFPTLNAQPFGYDQSNTRAGRTARKWAVQGFLKPSEWLTLLGVYDAWRNLRIEDEDSATSGVVGTTINFSGKGAGGQTWTSVPCWFSAAPEATQAGAYLAVVLELVDAAQALEVLLKEQEAQEEDLPDFGTYTLGTTVLKLLRPVEAYGSGPNLELTTVGTHYITGPLVVQKVRDIEGTTNAAGWTGVRAWYESTVVLRPSVGDWFPINAPSVSAASKVIDGVKTTEYTVTVQLGQVL